MWHQSMKFDWTDKKTQWYGMTKSLRDLTLFRQNFDIYIFFNVNDLYNAKKWQVVQKFLKK